MATILRDSFAVVVRTRPQAIPLALIIMRKFIDGFPFLSHMSMGLRLAVIRAARAPLIKRGGHRACFHATMLTNMVIKVTFGDLCAQQINGIIFQNDVLYHTEFDFL